MAPSALTALTALTARRVERLKMLAKRAGVRQRQWLRLFRDPDVWNDFEKRAAMLQARWHYHDAVLAWEQMLTAGQNDGESPSAESKT